MMTHFHIMRTKKHKMLSIVVLNMAKYTIISLILTDFEPIFSYSTCFEKLLGGHSAFKKSQVQKSLFPRFLVWKSSLIFLREHLRINLHEAKKGCILNLFPNPLCTFHLPPKTVPSWTVILTACWAWLMINHPGPEWMHLVFTLRTQGPAG